MVSIATVCFALLAVDLLAIHRLALLDASVHSWITEHTDSVARSFVGGKLLSNIPITVGWLGWAAMAAVVAALPNRPSGSTKALRHLGIATTFYVFGGGSITHGDPFLVNALKHFFLRVRPSAVHSTFAFPSGHTTAATFMVGTLLFVLLPALIEAASATMPPYRPFLESAIGKRLIQWRWRLWATAVASTAAGRVLADAHWTTDVMAGACLGSALVGSVALLCSAVDAALEEET
jgi:membrane-associated phospholipid phosphatase